ncbi:DMT family transporter [Gordonia amicalis]|uniref:DMT family transporter n=1 Tax=Gordonia amicalis TaxID=89053 RepID=UPI003A803B9D
MPWILLIGAIVSEVAATLSLKGSESLPALYLVVVVGYATVFMLAAVLKRGMGIGVAYGVWSATGVALTAVLASLIFDEAFSPVMAVGIVCIMIGVVLVESGSSSHAPVAAMIDEA